jgi:hypothetical protein
MYEHLESVKSLDFALARMGIARPLIFLPLRRSFVVVVAKVLERLNSIA